jgi:hypothetical protein
MWLHGVHCEGLLNMAVVFSELHVARCWEIPNKLKAIHSVTSVRQSALHYQVLQKLCIVLCCVFHL